MEEENDDLKIYSEEVRDVLSEPPKFLFRWGNTMLFGFIFLLLLLSYFIKYPDIITAPIVITTEVPPEKIIARSTGSIQKIFVKDRVNVKEGTRLAIIENTADYHDVFILKNIIDTLRINRDDFIFPTEETLFLQLGNIKDAFVQFEKDYLNYRLNKNLAPYEIESMAQRSEIRQLHQRLELLKQQKTIGEKELEFKRKELNRFDTLYHKGVISAQEWETKGLEYLQNEKELKNLGLQISQLQSAVIDLNRNSKTTVVHKKMDKINLLRNALQSFNQLKKAIQDWELQYVLSSSLSGTISYLQVWSKSQEVNAGETIFTIIPAKNGKYIGKALAAAQNSGKLKIGQKVNIHLDAYPYRQFGILEGKITSISLTPNNEGFYLIDVSLPPTLETSYGEKIDFQQEMTGTANIITEDLRLIERLFYEIRKIFKR